MGYMLIVSSNQEIIQSIRNCFGPETEIDTAFSKDSTIERLQKKRPDFIFIDMDLLYGSVTGNNYETAFEPFWEIYPAIEIVVIARQDLVREAVRAVKAGANDYITHPVNSEEVKYVTENIRESAIVHSELDYLRGEFWDRASLTTIETKNPSMKKVYEKIRSVAPTKSTVLLVGETGAGKGVLASIIHRHSNRRNEQFISVHCGAIPDTLIESELFGHEKGAFTGAVKRKLGKFEIANGGTIFLDEIATITPSTQIKLLQVLQDGIFQRVGGEEELRTDVRIIAATNADLLTMCEEGTFRKDLYFRLNVFPIEIPPLRDRTEDIPHFIEIFLRKLNKVNTKEIYQIDRNVLEALKSYSWPGNIRELENLIERAYILETDTKLTPESFPIELFGSKGTGAKTVFDYSLKLAEARNKAIDDFERRYLKELLNRNRGSIKNSAQAAGITTRQLNKLMVKYGMKKEDFKTDYRPESNHGLLIGIQEPLNRNPKSTF